MSTLPDAPQRYRLPCTAARQVKCKTEWVLLPSCHEGIVRGRQSKATSNGWPRRRWSMHCLPGYTLQSDDARRVIGGALVSAGGRSGGEDADGLAVARKGASGALFLLLRA